MEEPQRSSGQDIEAGIDASRGTRDAAETLVGAVERAGHPWRFVPAGALSAGLPEGAPRTWPIVLPDGEMLGMVVREEGGPDRHDELLHVLLRNFATVASTESAARDAQRRAREAEAEARVDARTGLPNRRAWDEALEAEAARMARHGRASIVIVLDLDDLKVVNDTEGHLAGDLLIRRAALAVRRAVRMKTSWPASAATSSPSWPSRRPTLTPSCSGCTPPSPTSTSLRRRAPPSPCPARRSETPSTRPTARCTRRSASARPACRPSPSTTSGPSRSPGQ